MAKKRGLAALLAATTTLLLSAAASHSSDARTESAPDVDLTGIESVLVRGAGSEVVVTTGAGGSHGVRISESGWARHLCGMSAEVSRDGNRLDVHVLPKGWAAVLHCDLRVALDLPEGTAVEIRQDATVASLTGAFATVAIDSSKAVVNFSGSVGDVRVATEQAVVDLVLSGPAQSGKVSIQGRQLVANVGLERGVPVSYAVDAPVAVFSRGVPDTPGAARRIEISSDVLKGSVYPVESGAPRTP